MDIGSNMSGLERQGLEQGWRGESAQPVGGDLPHLEVARLPEPAKSATRRKHSLWESLTASLELACRGYLCMQIVDCDPVTDPDCSAAGTKVVVREVAKLPHPVDGGQ